MLRSRVFSPRKMISIYGRRSSAPPRKHNHFVPDGYIPPKSRQKIVSPRKRTSTPQSILKNSAGSSSRNNTPSRLRQHSNPGGSSHDCPPDGPPARPRPTPPPRGNSLTEGSSLYPNQGVVFSNIQMMPRSILKSANSNPAALRKAQQQNDHDRSTGHVGTQTRVTKSACTSPRGALPRGASPAGSHKSSYVDLEYITSPLKAVPIQKKVLDGLRRGPPSYDGSYMGSPISVVDKYDERDNPIWWKSTYYRPGRRGPPAKSSLRPHARHPNILFDRVVTGDENRTSSCGASCSTQSCRSWSCEDDQSEEDSSWKVYAPCCAPLDWEHDPVLKSVGCNDRSAYRQCKLEEYLSEVCPRRCDAEPAEGFGSYLIRCYAYANEELNAHKSNHLLGYVDHQLSPLDVWVLRLYRGTVSRLLRAGTAYSGRDNELFLRMLREECAALHAERNSVLRRHLNETERRVSACDEQERNYKKILLLSQRSPMGVMQNLKSRDWR